MVDYWKPGHQILLRSTWGPRVIAACPVTVVHDSSDLLATYLAADTIWKSPRFDQGAPRLPDGMRSLVDEVWRTDLIRLMRPDDAHSLLGLYEGLQGRLSSWYVNLESPNRRTSRGIDFEDHVLDIVISSDLSGWRWKDEETLKTAVSRGLVTVDKAKEIRAEGERVIERVKSRSSPFGDGWEMWRPDPAWPVPELAVSWDAFE